MACSVYEHGDCVFDVPVSSHAPWVGGLQILPRSSPRADALVQQVRHILRANPLAATRFDVPELICLAAALTARSSVKFAHGIHPGPAG
jgi:hypothetical protein